MKSTKYIFKVLDLQVEATRKDIKYLHISVHPPTGNIIVSAPLEFRDDEIKNALIKRVPWIRKHQRSFLEAIRETSREMVSNESHYLWGQRYLLEVEQSLSNDVKIRGNKIIVKTINYLNCENKRKQLYDFYSLELQKIAEPILLEYMSRLQLSGINLKFIVMKTRWGSFNKRTNTISLNIELAKHPMKYTSYIIAHELSHLKSSRHGTEFQMQIEKLIPNWDTVNNSLALLPVSTLANKMLVK